MPDRGGTAAGPPAGRPRCSDLARLRGDPAAATAPPARGFLLVEVPGPWGPEPWTTSRLDPGVGSRVAARAAAAGVRPLLVRRPGPHPAGGPVEPRSWALVGVGGGAGVAWSAYLRDEELLDVDPALPPTPAGTGASRVALVCTHGRLDVCCAVRGRPVAAALVRAGWQVWETTHVGGCRFAANVLALPDGELFGGLDPTSAPTVLGRLLQGRLALAHHRGRFGDARESQAARHHTMLALQDDRVGAVRTGRVQPLGPGLTEVDVEHGGDAYRVRLAARATEPGTLTCGGPAPTSALVHELVSMTGPLAGR